ncbi:hypothetical protein [uncultured Bartonella sp.]|uniref:hypothetical protein n=1 Tax=uncultured Bartonella sp. TaxID=104108 RepID=UPI0025F3E09B|nr:hypothetical protein [uncultured Bartonella sp.]
MKDTAFGQADKKNESIIFYHPIKRSLYAKSNFSKTHLLKVRMEDCSGQVFAAISVIFGVCA